MKIEKITQGWLWKRPWAPWSWKRSYDLVPGRQAGFGKDHIYILARAKSSFSFAGFVKDQEAKSSFAGFGKDHHAMCKDHHAMCEKSDYAATKILIGS